MHWVIQDSPYREEGHNVLRQTLEHACLPFVEVKTIPFTFEITPEPTFDNPIVVMGSVRLGQIAQQRGWTPGIWMNENFDYAQYLIHYGSRMLNDGAIICRIGDVGPWIEWDSFFMRPTSDGKAFAGMTIDRSETIQWASRLKQIEEGNYTTIDSSTLVVIAPLKEIAREYRFFVVDGKVVTGSLYKVGGRVTYNSQVDDSWDFAQRMVDLWQPARAFVIDIALFEGSYYVLEVNCLNSAGYYAADVSKLVQAIEYMEY